MVTFVHPPFFTRGGTRSLLCLMEDNRGAHFSVSSCDLNSNLLQTSSRGEGWQDVLTSTAYSQLLSLRRPLDIGGLTLPPAAPAGPASGDAKSWETQPSRGRWAQCRGRRHAKRKDRKPYSSLGTRNGLVRSAWVGAV